ncbi:MAG: aldo/keto reductase [Verrucomicrobiae bacterium]|nr:aldo/keto reductase [Verrucomicrobiae bacterium]
MNIPKTAPVAAVAANLQAMEERTLQPSADPQTPMTRREVLKWLGAAGLTGILSRIPAGWAGEPPAVAADAPPLPQVPRRVLGKTGESIPILLVGCAMDFDQRFDPRLAEAVRFGVNYFDTADCYAGGSSETAIGNFVQRLGNRKAVWITTKSCPHDVPGMLRTLEQSLRRLQTDYVDLFFLHALVRKERLSREMKEAVAELKKNGKIRYFGFSCHSHTVAELLQEAARLDWIDAVMFKYNFREYGNKELNDAMDACHKAGVGLIAMKTQGSAASFEEHVKKFEGAQFNRHQAVLKAVWADPRITAAVSHMDTLEKMKQNIAAALDRRELSEADRAALMRYAEQTRCGYCAGCDHICGAALPPELRVADTLRFLTYHDAYGDRAKARMLFARLPESARHWEHVDFTTAAGLCPNGVNLPALMRRAAEVLA